MAEIFLWLLAGIWILFMGFLFIPDLLTGAPAERRSSWYLRNSIVILVPAIIVIMLLNMYENGALLVRVVPDTLLSGVTGLALTAIGLGFAGWARVHLGRFWSSMVMIKAGHQLIRTGPYRIVRNPMYTGFIVAYAGAAIAIGVLLAFVAIGIGVVAIWVKIRAEEEILLEKFGDEYLQYKREVKAIIPFIL